jgi:retinol dehydrogenase 12
MSNDPVVTGRLTCLVTGATSGIGEAIARQLVTAGHHVIVVARTTERGQRAQQRIAVRTSAGQVDLLTADLSNMGEVRALGHRVQADYPQLDVLVLNAGVARPRREMTRDGFEADFATNHLSAFLLAQTLGDLLVASAPARIVTVSSSAHAHVTSVDLDAMVTGGNFHHLRTYSATKLLNLLFTSALARRLDGSGVTANAADPGFVRSNLGHDAPGLFGAFLALARPFQLSPVRGAATPVHLATSAEVAGITGGYFVKSRPATPSPLAQDHQLAERLWDLSTRLVG